MSRGGITPVPGFRAHREREPVMRLSRTVTLAALLVLTSLPAVAQVPRSVFIEEGGATW